MYENTLKSKQTAEEQEENKGDLDYNMNGLASFIDNDLADLTCLIFDEVQKIYVPHGKEWLKSRVYCYLKRHAKK